MRTLICLIAWLLIAGCCTMTRAALVMNAVETGGDVVISGSGTLNLAGLSLNDDSASLQGLIDPSSPEIELGAAPASIAPIDIYGFFAVSGPTQFGPGSATVADTGTGDRFGVANIPGVSLAIIVPRGYVSGNPLAGSLTFNSTDFATLGMSAGTYVWTWGSGQNTDSLTLSVAVPEASSAALVGGVAALAFAFRRRQFRRNCPT